MNDYVAPTSGDNVNQGTVASGNAVTITNSDDTTVTTSDTEIDLGIGRYRLKAVYLLGNSIKVDVA